MPPADVLEGTVFWCVDPAEGKWGKQTGTMPNQGAVNITPGTADQTIPAGYHNSSGTVAGDANLVPENIISGKEIFGVAGSIPDQGAVNITPGTADQKIPAGYHNGSGTVAGDADLTAGNIKSSVDIFGLTGTSVQASGTAVAGEVLATKTFSNSAGASTGTMPDNGAVNITPGTANQAIPAGYHNGLGTVAGDANLAAGNIRSGASIFGVSGTVIQSSGDASAGDVLSGKTFSNAGAAGVSGSMANNGAVSITPGTANQAIPAGYHNGSGAVAGDADLVNTNIKSGVDIFGVTGNVIQSSGDASAGDVLSGKTFSNAGSAGMSGTMTNNGAVNITPGTANQTIPQGYHNGSGTVAGDANLASGNIVSGKTIFGVAGSAVVPAYPSPVYTTGQTFADNGDGTLTDSRTGLIWLKNANCTETVGGIIGGQNTWNNALTFCNNLEAGKCGLTDGSAAGDWRLPHINELISLTDRATFNPALPSAHPFTGVQTNYYWSATAYAVNTSEAWDVALYDGYVFYDDKSNTHYVWPVR